MFIPVKTDVPVRFTPLANMAIVSLNVVIHVLAGLTGETERLHAALGLDGAEPTWWAFLTYQFLHADWWHLLGNMLFLYVFGNAVNVKMGHFAYVLFYLTCGVLSGVAFVWGSTDPVIGASGAIAGITAAFAVLFPRANIALFYWFFFVGVIEVPGLLLVLVKFILWDNLLAPGLGSGESAVAYEAHLGGYFFGGLIAFVLLAVRALPRDQFDLFALLQRWKKRREWRDAMADPQAAARAQLGRVAAVEPPGDARAGGGIPVARPVAAPPPPVSPEQQRIDELRRQIQAAAGDHRWAEAAALYQDLVRLDATQFLPKATQLDVANYLMQQEQWAAAAEAYVKYLSRYPKAEAVEQVELIAGLVLSRYLGKDDEAEPWLRRAVPRLHRPDEKALAEHLLGEIATRRGGSNGGKGEGGTPGPSVVSA